MPFTPGALVQMLETLYPAVTPANLARAREEQPTFFADGVLFGSKGDKLRLPDGSEFDLIVAAGGPIAGRRWQAALIDPTAPSVDDPFARDEGSLLTLDEDLWTPAHDSTFTSLVGQFVSDTRGVDDALGRAQRPVIDLVGVDPDALLSGHEADVVSSQRADRATLGELYALDELHAGNALDGSTDDATRDVSDVQAAHGALSPRIDAGAREIPVEPPLPDDVDPAHWDPRRPGPKQE